MIGRLFSSRHFAMLLLCGLTLFAGSEMGSAQTGAPAPIASFGSVAVGSTSVAQPVSFTLPDTASISSISIVPAVGGRTEYIVGALSGCVADGVTVIPLNTVCVLSVAFKPGYPGTHQTPLKVVTSTGIRYFGLLGTGIGPAMSFSPANAYPFAGCNPSATTCAGTEGSLATTYKLPTTQDFAVDNAGNVYILQFGTMGQAGVRKVDAITGNITTIAGIVNAPYGGAGHLATQTQFYDPSAIAIDGQGNVYIADYTGYNGVSLIYKIDIGTGLVLNYAGTGTNAVSPSLPIVNVPFQQAVFTGVGAMTFDPAGNLYVSQPGGIVELNATTGLATFVAGGPPANSFKDSTGLTVDAAGNIFFVDPEHSVVRRVDAVTHQVTIVAGIADPTTPPSVIYSGPATGAVIYPYNVALDAAGNLYIDNLSQQTSLIRRVDAATQNMTIVAGYGYGGTQTFSYPNYPALRATDTYAVQPRIDVAGNMYFVLGNGNLSILSKTDITQAQLRFPFVPYSTSVTNGQSYPNSTYETVAVTNIGNAPLVVAAGAPTVTGAAFALDDPTTTGCASSVSSPAGFTLAPGNSCYLATDFIPTVGGVNLGSLTLTDNAVNSASSTQTVALLGVSASNGLTVSPASLTFANTTVGATSATLTAVVTNSSAYNVLLSTGSRINSDSADFTETDSCGVVSSSGTLFAAGTTCTLTFTFTPQSAGTLTGSFTLTDYFSSANTITVTLSGVGTSGAGLSITPITQTFASTAVGSQTAAQTSMLTNNGSTPVYLSSGSLTDSTDFTQSDNCNGLLAGGASCLVSFTFTPKSASALSSTYAIHDLNNPGTPLNVVLSGNGTAAPAPVATLTPTSLTFTANAGSTSATQNTTLSNTGNAALSISSIAIGGTNTTAFTQTGTCGATLAAGASCAISIAFKPSAAGGFAASLVVTDNSGSSGTTTTTQTTTLSGTATAAPAPVASLTPSSLSFTTVAGSTSATQNATLSNTGNAVLTISAIALGGTNATAFTQTGTCGSTLAAGTSCAIGITFNPSAAGGFAASVIVTDNSGSAGTTTTTQVVALSGTGTAVSAPQATVTPASITFGSVSLGVASAAQTVTLSNPGTASLGITSITLTGTNAAAFSIGSNTCGASLAADASCTISVSFLTNTAGSDRASLTIIDTVGTQIASLAGAVLATSAPDFTLTATPAVQSSYRGRSVTYTLQLASLLAANPFTNAANLSVTGLPAGASVNFAPASVVPGASSPATAVMTVTIPAVVGETRPGPWPRSAPLGVGLAALLFGFCLPRSRKRKLYRLLSLVFLIALAGSLVGCGTSTGFAVPTSTSNLVVTATSGTTAHSTTVTLTIE